jgi:hypothetical protein
MELSTVLPARKSEVVTGLRSLVPSAQLNARTIFVKLTRHAVAALAGEAPAELGAARATERWYPAFAGHAELSDLPRDRTLCTISGIVIPGMGPYEDKSWEHRVVQKALERLAKLLEAHFAHAHLCGTIQT